MAQWVEVEDKIRGATLKLIFCYLEFQIQLQAGGTGEEAGAQEGEEWWAVYLQVTTNERSPDN